MIYLIRHPSTAVDADTCYGRLDVALAETSTAEIEQVLKSPPKVQTIHSSPSRRCRTLAEAVGERDGVPVRTDSRLFELDLGAWEGRRWNEVPRAEVDAWARDVWDARPGAGESLRSLWTRIEDFRTKELCPVALNPGTATLVVSHQGPLRVLWAQLTASSPARIFTDRFAHGIAGLRTIS